MAHVIDLTQIGIVIFTSKEEASKQFICKHEAETEFQMTGSKSIRATLKSVSYTKKIYEPCSLTCTIQLESIDKTVTPIEDVIQLARSFKGKRVSAFRGDLSHNIAENYFVYRSVPMHEKDDAVSVKLEVYSMDKLLDIMSYSRSYVSRKLRKEILGDAIARCKYGDLIVPVADDDELQYISYEDHKKEFVQPYIVQFNETPYSMLRRTANRSGEFLFFESGGIHLGLPKTTTIPEIGNAEDDQIHFKSVSYSEAITSDFGTDLQYQSDDYEQGNNAEYYNTLLEYAEAPFAANLELVLKSLNSKSDQDTFKSFCDTYNLNKQYRDLYDRAKSTVISYNCLNASLQKEQKAKAELCDEKDPNAPSKKAKVDNAPICLQGRQKTQQDNLKQKEQELNQLEEARKKYLALEAECQALKKNWKEDPADPSDAEKQKKYTLYSEKQAELNLLIEKQGSIGDLNQKTDACLGEIISLKKDLNDLRTVIDTLKSSNFTDGEKLKVLESSKYAQEVTDYVNKKIKRHQENIDEITTAVERLKSEPEVLKQHKTEQKWNLFVEWSDFFGSAAASKLDNIWKNILEEGKNRYPFDIQKSVEEIKKFAKEIKEDKVELSNDAKANKASLLRACDSVISYCDAILTMKMSKDDIPTEKSVYHMEYGNDEYLETYKKDQTGNFTEYFFSDYSIQNTPIPVNIGKFLFRFAGSVLSDKGSLSTSFEKKLYLSIAQPAVLNSIYVASMHRKYNDNYIENYKHNGMKVKDTEYGGTEEVSLFATYNKVTKVATLNKAFSAIFYKEIWDAEKQISEQKIIIHIDTAVNKVAPKLGQKIKYGDKTYIITSITGNRVSELHNLISEEVVEAVPLLEYKQDSSEPVTLIVPPVSGYPRYVKAEPQLATVVDDDDPSFYARVRVRYKWQPGGKEKKSGDEPSPWIRVSTPFASHGGGMLFIPKPGNQVMIDYENGNIERPFVSNAVYNADNRPPMPEIDKKPTRMMISSPNGHSIKFSDTTAANTFLGLFSSFDPVIKPAAKELADLVKADSWGFNPGGGITISDAYGFYSISCSADKRAINISSPLGNIGLSAFTGIKISAPNGDINIEGKNVSITANNEVKIVSGATVKQKIDNSKKKVSAVAEAVNNVVGAVTDIIPQIIDLNLFRYVYERKVPPVSGAMAIKSYRFLLIDAGDKDLSVEDIQSNEELRRKLAKYKGWRKLKGENDGTTAGMGWGNFLGMTIDNTRTALANLVKNALPEKNNWRVDSEKSAIIVAGKVFGTNEEKTALRKGLYSKRDMDATTLYSGDNAKEWNLAAEYKPWQKKVVSWSQTAIKGAGKLVGGLVGLAIEGAFGLLTLPFWFGKYSYIGIRKKWDNRNAPAENVVDENVVEGNDVEGNDDDLLGGFLPNDRKDNSEPKESDPLSDCLKTLNIKDLGDDVRFDPENID